MGRLNLQKKLLLGLTVIITVLIIILSSAFYNYLSSEMINKEYKTSQKITERTSSQIDELYKQMDMGALFIVKNSIIEDVLYGLHNDKKISEYTRIKYQGQARDQLKILSFYFPNMTSAVIFDSKIGFYYHSGLVDEESEVNKRLKDISWYENLIPPGKQLRILPPHQDYWVSISRPVISVIRRLVSSANKDLGLFEVDIPYWNLKNICSTNTVSENSSTLLFDNQGILVYPFENDSMDETLLNQIKSIDIYNKIKDTPDASGEFNVSGSKMLYTAHKSNFTQFTTVLINKETSLQKQLYTYSFFTILAGITILIAVFFAFFILVRSLTKPLKQLTSTIENVSLDNMNLEIPHDGHDELKMLNDSFNAMFSKLKDSIHLVYESKLRETNANLLALQAQINPHFLYNTLGVISASSEKFGNAETASMCNKLSNMMRYIVSPAKSMVDIGDEVAHTLNYLDLMRNHYIDYTKKSDSFLEFEIDIPASMNAIQVPRMILQPIVENCINHGFENILPPWYIKIKGQILEDDGWYLSVEDNGSGFETDFLDQLNVRIREYSINLKDGNFKQTLHIGGMGILNTYARLAISFKDNTLFKIENNREKGCTVTFGKKDLSREMSLGND